MRHALAQGHTNPVSQVTQRKVAPVISRELLSFIDIFEFWDNNGPYESDTVANTRLSMQWLNLKFRRYELGGRSQR